MLGLSLLAAGLVATASALPEPEQYDDPPPLCWINPHPGRTMAENDLDPHFLEATGTRALVWRGNVPDAFTMAAAYYDAGLRAEAQKIGYQLGSATTVMVDYDHVADGQVPIAVAIPILDSLGEKWTNTAAGKPENLPPAKLVHVRYSGPYANIQKGFDAMNAWSDAHDVPRTRKIVVEFYNLADIQKDANDLTVEICGVTP